MMEEVCRKVVKRLLGKYQWSLLDAKAFEELVCPEVVGDPICEKLLGEMAGEDEFARRVGFIAIGIYAEHLYQACQPQNKGSDQYDKAWQDLSDYLFNIARFLRPDAVDDAQDAAQHALLKIYYALSGQQDSENSPVSPPLVNNPRAFLSYAAFQVRAGFTALDRQKKVGKVESVSLAGQSQETKEQEEEQLLMAGAWSENPEQEAMLHIVHDEFLQEVISMIERMPKAEKQIRAACLKYLCGMSNAEIGVWLGITGYATDADKNAAIATTVSRGKEKLSQNSRLRELYQQWLELLTRDNRR